MKPGLDENEPADEHVEVDVLVEGELVREAHLAEEGDAVAEDEEDAEHRVHHQPSTHRTRNHVEWVRCHSVEHGEVLEVVSSLDHDGNVEANDEVEEGKEGEVVPPVAQREVVGQLFPGFGGTVSFQRKCREISKWPKYKIFCIIPIHLPTLYQLVKGNLPVPEHLTPRLPCRGRPRRHQPLADADRQVLQKTLVPRQLVLQVVHRDPGATVLQHNDDDDDGGVLEHKKH